MISVENELQQTPFDFGCSSNSSFSTTSQMEADIMLIGDKNPAWKGDNASISAIHKWIRGLKPKPELCERCNMEQPKHLSNNDHIYKRDLADWEWLCVKCHQDKDGQGITHGLSNTREYSMNNWMRWAENKQNHLKKYQQEYRKKNLDEIRRRDRERYKRDREKKLAYQKEYQKLNKEKISKQRKKYREDKKRRRLCTQR